MCDVGDVLDEPTMSRATMSLGPETTTPRTLGGWAGCAVELAQRVPPAQRC